MGTGFRGVSAQEGKGYTPPLVYNAMDSKLPGHIGAGIKSIDKNIEVGCYHCSCVLSVDVEDDEEVCKPEIKGHVTKTVKKKFSKAAYNPVADYYCPTGYDQKSWRIYPMKCLMFHTDAVIRRRLRTLKREKRSLIWALAAALTALLPRRSLAAKAASSVLT